MCDACACVCLLLLVVCVSCLLACLQIMNTTCVHVLVFTCAYARKCVRVCAYMHIYVDTCMSMSMYSTRAGVPCLHVCTRAGVLACMYAYLHACLNVDM